jgi:hypothetical protein
MCSKGIPPRHSIRGCSTRASRRSSGADTPFYGWHYPPFFLAVAAALALMPYQLALIVWQGVTLLLYLLAIGRSLGALPSPWLVPGIHAFLAARRQPQDVDGPGPSPGMDGAWFAALAPRLPRPCS